MSEVDGNVVRCQRWMVCCEMSEVDGNVVGCQRWMVML